MAAGSLHESRHNRGRARCVPDPAVNRGIPRSCPDSPSTTLTCGQADHRTATSNLLSSRP
jgi:hypothetical protein